MHIEPGRVLNDCFHCCLQMWWQTRRRRQRRQRLAYVLAGQAGRDIRWFLKTARTGFSHGVEIHLPKSGLHASANLNMDRNDLSLQPSTIFIPGGVQTARGVSPAICALPR